MTLYRDASIDEMRVAKFKWVVEAAPCVHGNYAQHHYLVRTLTIEGDEWVDYTICDGKPKGDNE